MSPSRFFLPASRCTPAHRDFLSSSRYLPALSLWSPLNTFSLEYGYMIGGLLLAVAILLFFLHRRQIKQDGEQLTPLEDPVFITKVFTEALGERCKFSMSCTRKNLSTSMLTGHMTAQGKKPELLLELVDAQHPEEWATAPVDVYFHFNDGPETIFYHFSSFVQTVQQKEDTWVISLALPSVLTNNQRRSFVRIEPGAGMMEAVTAWALPSPAEAKLPARGRDLGQPHFAFRPPKITILTVQDISAGGIRIRLSVEHIRAKQVRCAPGCRMVLLLGVDALRSDGSRKVIWTAGIVRRAVILPGKQHADLGIQFTHWCTTENLELPMEWELVEPDGEIPFFLRWVGRANVLLNRLSA